jgi:hypothetical protein
MTEPGPPVRADVGIAGDRVAQIGLPGADGLGEAAVVIEAVGKAVCPGFINILSHSNRSILLDPRSLGELTQGVTTQAFGRRQFDGPAHPQTRAELERDRDGLNHEVCWTRLSEYLSYVERRGIPQLRRAPRRRAERGLGHRRGDHPGGRSRLRPSSGDHHGNGSHASAGRRGDGGRRVGDRVGADLPAGELREHRRTHRALWRRPRLASPAGWAGAASRVWATASAGQRPRGRRAAVLSRLLPAGWLFTSRHSHMNIPPGYPRDGCRAGHHGPRSARTACIGYVLAGGYRRRGLVQ